MVTDGVPQVQLQGRPCSMFASDLDAGVECTVNRFADDPKLVGAVHFLEEQETLQRDLDRLVLQAMINGIKFDMCKCQTLNLGQRNAGLEY